MVEIEKKGNNIKIDGVEISIKDYNDRCGFYKNDENDIKEEYVRLAREILVLAESKKKPNGEFYSTEEYLSEAEKTKKVNRNLYHETEKIYEENNQEFYAYSSGSGFRKIGSKVIYGTSSFDDDEIKIKEFVDFNNKKIEKFLKYFKEILPKLKQIFTQKEKTGNDDWSKDYNDPSKDKSREELGKRADEIEAYRKKVKGEIEAELNKEPKITKEELESDNKEWESEIWNSHIALGEKEINDIKSRVLADIEVKRATKQGKKPITGQDLKNLARDAIYEIDTERNKDENTDFFVTSEELEISNPDWRKRITEATDEKAVKHLKVKVLVDLRFKRAQKVKDKDAWQKVQNGSVEDMSESELAAAIQVFEKEEGNKNYKRGDKSQSAEDKLIEKDPELYKEMVIEALKQRLKDNGLDEEEFTKLESDYRKLVNKEITEIEDFKRIKNEVGKRIGEEGAKSKWNSLFNRAKALIAKAKTEATEKIKDDIKAIQKQMSGLKSNTNAYLASFYQDEKAKVESMEKDLSSCLNAQTNPPKETPWGVIIPISLAVVALIGVAAVVIVRRRKQDKMKNK